MTNPRQLTQIIRCSVALGGVIRPDPSAMYSSIAAWRASQKVRVGSCQSWEGGGEVQVQDSRIDGPWRRLEGERR